jgi:hypothetical protein
MAAPFRIYRILCSTPPDLETDRLIFESTLASFVEQTTFPQQVLFAGASFRPEFDAERHRSSGEANVRMCDFFLHIFSDTWPGTAFKAYIDLAQACIDDPSMPMRRIAVLFKNFPEADEKVRKYRDSLTETGNCDIREFREPADLDRVLREVFASWWAAVQTKP